MKYTTLIVASLLWLVAGAYRATAEMDCAEFLSGEALCDDGAQMYYRPSAQASFVLLDEATRAQVWERLTNQTQTGAAAGSADGNTTFYGSSGSVTSSGDCISLSAPGVSFMGSGC